ncbi:MAG: trypsin-like peptidase domain-containing protein [Cyclobacteriaceae bacterium]|nr:trypsin-like peptidase domain-containing protein [Cyclobacteriaceae bacterium]
MRRILLIAVVLLSAFIGAVLGAMYTLRYLDNVPDYTSIAQHQQVRMPGGSNSVTPINFENAAHLVTPAVVNINTVFGAGEFSLTPMDLNFDPMARPSGSGVIISDDGYIVTNQHVIEDATGIEVVLNDNQRYYAKVIGKDPSTDLALLKIKAKNLPYLRYGDSDQVVPGEWVLAVGNPFDLNSTVTAGIVSAKARNIGILRDKNNLQVESFIQTDAAVNPGNSGGALVNLKGELIGINSAIATVTGSYSGYSFAIPVNLVKKIMDDLLEFGAVQRGLLGVEIRDVTAKLANDQDLDVLRGVFINRVNAGSAADQSGIEAGDVITAIDGHEVGSVSELQELVARHRPGHSVLVTYRRDGKVTSVKTTLKNFEGRAAITRHPVNFEIEGAQLEDVAYAELTRRNLEGGVRIRTIGPGKWLDAGIKKGFIITHIDKVNVDNVEDLNRILEYKSGGMLVEGIYFEGTRAVYGVQW